MRIVYDDAKQEKFVEILYKFMWDKLNVTSAVRYDWGMNRIQIHLVRKQLDEFLEPLGFSIGQCAFHKYGLGNNCNHPIYFHPEGSDEVQHCANINLNQGLYSECYISVEDYKGKRVSPAYELTMRGVKA